MSVYGLGFRVSGFGSCGEGLGQTCEHRSPPPSVVLGAEVEVAHDHRNLDTRDNEDEEHQAQEAEHVVKSMLPFAV
jgi:hypothetical protein